MAAARAAQLEIGRQLRGLAPVIDPHGNDTGGRGLEHRVQEGAVGAPQDERGVGQLDGRAPGDHQSGDRKSTRLNSSHVAISYAVFCLKKKKSKQTRVW